jgi:hypothetical protein
MPATHHHASYHLGQSMRDDQQDDGRNHDNCESASIEILSGAGDQVLEELNSDTDD